MVPIFCSWFDWKQKRAVMLVWQQKGEDLNYLLDESDLGPKAQEQYRPKMYSKTWIAYFQRILVDEVVERYQICIQIIFEVSPWWQMMQVVVFWISTDDLLRLEMQEEN